MSVVARHPRTIQEHCISRLGLWKGTRCAAFIVSWAIASEVQGRPLGDGDGVTAGIRDYAEYWEDNERTAYRRLAEFRTVFAYDTPQPIVDQVFAAKLEAAYAQGHPLGALALA